MGSTYHGIQKYIKYQRAMRPNKFGGVWTEKKIQMLVAYVKAYLVIMNKYRFFELIYFDGFAGSGEIEVQEFDKEQLQFFKTTENGGTLIEGTAPRIVSIDSERPFDIYYFVEKDKKKASSLNEKLKPYRNKSKIYVVSGDFGDRLSKFIAYMKEEKEKRRGLVFIDPFGMQVNWNHLEPLRQIHVDLWILVPTGIVMNRFLKKDGKLKESRREKLEEAFGLSWKEIEDEIYPISTNQQMDLFSSSNRLKRTKKPKATEKLAELYITRMKTVWRYVSHSSPVKNTRGSTMFHLIFASQNATGVKIANDMIEKGRTQ